MSRRNSDTPIFDSLKLEGSLFVPAILEKAALGKHDLQTVADYQLAKGLTLLDEQGRSFRIASAQWKNFNAARERADIDSHKATCGFVAEFLRDCLGYGDLAEQTQPIEIESRGYPIHLLARGRVPVVVASHDVGLDVADERFHVIGSGMRRKSPYQLAQQFLNASEPCAWAIVANGLQLRILRDADTLTRPQYLEFDLELILRNKRYADFRALWFLIHASRAGEATAPGDQCVWETWQQQGHEQGQRVRKAMRVGVTDALLELGAAFLKHHSNRELRERLESGELTTDAYFQQILRLVYRFLFVFTVEEREILHAEDASPQAVEAYRRGYSLKRLRDRALRQTGFDNHYDLWQCVRILFRSLAQGEPHLALPALGGLFAGDQCPDLDSSLVSNRSLLRVMRQLRWSDNSGQRSAVDYRNMGPEELGSVYESLLELVPTIDLPGRFFGFAGITDAESSDGHARKTSGSYYTPDSLVQELLDSALEPVIDQKLKERPDNPTGALLEIAVIDPACGSGHFLLGAARRLAERLAELRAIDGSARPADYRHALREVINHCIYGVDRNPMAIELARTALWLEGFEPAQALSFLDHHLLCGDALLGIADFKQLEKGIPKDAFKALSGDDKETCKQLAAINAKALKSLKKRLADNTAPLFEDAVFENAFAKLNTIEAMPDGSTDEVAAKAKAYSNFLKEAQDSSLARAADLAIAAFLTPKKSTENALQRCPTTQTLIDLLFAEPDRANTSSTIEAARAICQEARVLHWPIRFARIFGKGGFDCALGNPPWERIKLQDKEFFATRAPEIANAKNKSERDKLISALLEEGQENACSARIYNEYISTKRLAEATSAYAHVNGAQGGRYPLTGVGDVNTYSLFSECILSIRSSSGWAGFIVPIGIATDDTAKDFFSHILNGKKLVKLAGLHEIRRWFKGTDDRSAFCLITLGKSDRVKMLFHAKTIEDLRVESKWFELEPNDFDLLNPNTGTCPIFMSKSDAELTKKIYGSVPVLHKEKREGQLEINPWGAQLTTLFDMSRYSHLFHNQQEQGALPLYEAKMIHQYDHRWATYSWDSQSNGYVIGDLPIDMKRDPETDVTPRYWMPESEVYTKIARVPKGLCEAWKNQDEEQLKIVLATWILAGIDSFELTELQTDFAIHLLLEKGGSHFSRFDRDSASWLDPKQLKASRTCPPLTDEELKLIHNCASLGPAIGSIIEARTPRWLVGWRKIARSGDERTLISAVFPRSAAGDSIYLISTSATPIQTACLLGNLNSLTLDYIARQKLGGSSFSFHYLRQLPVFPPEHYKPQDIKYIVPRILELTYTTPSMKPWAEDLGFDGEPFSMDQERRSMLRAEMDAYFAKLYQLTKEDLLYILDPSNIHQDDYPSETFRVLKNNEMKQFGEYRTQRLVLEAWAALEAEDTPTTSTQVERASIPEADYLIELIPALLRTAENETLDLDTFIEAIFLLSQPSKLAETPDARKPIVVDSWLRTEPPGFSHETVFAAISELGELNLGFDTSKAKRRLVLKNKDAPISESAIANDANVAMEIIQSQASIIDLGTEHLAFQQKLNEIGQALA